ncbi:hypothetical protein SAMN05443377_1123 [Propionibacterium cyclohexanicum]|uniref:CBM-cenC domain-containing protein n=1 Tax=Propionibacterium cyclohexanicum TaxID=64702 RepID=A0A1H9SB86_9ACTN|nr:carbohydrate binding domain-containing protein [Propionibacterium cyclohexanicum]SER81633.1 hypothetical protein SAMN05443377_1123 [Propionibacterium cyclohexanicum]
MTMKVSRRGVLAGAMASSAVLASQVVWDASASADGASPSASASNSSGSDTASAVLDTITFGDAASELAHSFTGKELSATVTGALGQPARVINPLPQPSWWGGTIGFTLTVDPTKTTYVTVKLWGGDAAAKLTPTSTDTQDWRLQLFVDGKAVGWYDEGPVDNLDQIGPDPRSPGRFFMHTLPLPEAITAGKDELAIEIRAMGRIWEYGDAKTFFANDMNTPSRPLYRVYSHTEPQFVPESTDVLGSLPTVGTRANDDKDWLAKVRTRVLGDLQQLVYGGGAYSLDAWGFNELAEAYDWQDEENIAYHNPDALTALCAAIDGRYNAWKADPKVLTDSDQQWQGFGRVGLVLAYRWEELNASSASQPTSLLDLNVTPGYTTLVNAGFEGGGDTPIGWQSPGWAPNGTFTRDTSVAHSGQASIKLTSKGSEGMFVVQPAGATLVGSGQFSFTAWVKTDGKATTPRVDVLFFNASNKVVGTDHNFYVTTGTTDWQELSGSFPVPQGAANFQMWMRVDNGESAWFDDLSVTAPAPASAAPISRRAAYTDMLLSSRDYWKQNMRHYSNQAQITAIGIYQANRGLSLISPKNAWPEARAREWLYESIGSKPWLGPELPDGTRTKPLGEDYVVVSPKGLTRELGFVGSYGEVQDWLVMMYESVTRGYRALDAPELRERMVAMCKARGYFRHIDLDADGNRISRLESEIGWRNEVYPGVTTYTSRTWWDGNPLMTAGAFDDPDLTGWAQEMIDDGQFGPQLSLLLTNTGTRVGLNALRLLARDLPAFQAQGKSGRRLPIDWEADDFVFADEVAGALALKNGQEILFASPYWRSRQAVNRWGRVHLLTPSTQRTATIRETVEGDLSDETFAIQDWVTQDYAINNSGQPIGVPGGSWPAPGPQVHQAYAGEVMHLAKIPADADPALGSRDLGVEEVLVGIAPFYRLEYGRYLVGMNTTKDRSFELADPAGRHGQQLTGTRDHVDLSSPITVPPMSTVVVYLDPVSPQPSPSPSASATSPSPSAPSSSAVPSSPVPSSPSAPGSVAKPSGSASKTSSVLGLPLTGGSGVGGLLGVAAVLSAAAGGWIVARRNRNAGTGPDDGTDTE